MDVRRLDLSEWSEALPNTGFEPFHLPEALEVLDRYAPGELHLYGGFKGDRAAALLPVFVHDRAVARTIQSPPPSLGIPRLGPIVMSASPKQRKQEKVNRTFTEDVLDRLDADARGTLFRMLGSTTYVDPRPYVWAGFAVGPEFTYHLDIDSTTTDDLLSGFSRDLRKDVRKGEELDVTVGVEGAEAAEDVHESVAARYDEQGKTFGLSRSYVLDVIAALDERSRVYVARGPDEEFLNGMIFLYSNDAVYSWMGGIRGDYEGVSTKSLVQWEMLTDLVESPPVESVHRYDLSGANTERLCRYKAAFGGTLVPYYNVESTGTSMDVAKKAYQLVKG